MNSVVEHLPSICRILGLIPNTKQKIVILGSNNSIVHYWMKG
jgi:hypothetical protein